jgi:CheY-like chemotaxis protein
MTDERRREGRPAMATILVVDDSTAIRRIMGRTLTAAGYRVVEANDGRARSTRVERRYRIWCYSTSTCP